MNKQNYAVCCYTCEHNGQETCKGCNTILNGENEPYENWQLREDLCQKDKQIADLQSQLAESEKRIQAYEEIVEQKDEEISFANRDKTCIVKQLNDPKAYVLLEDYKQLKQQLAEWQDGTIICKWTDAENKVKELEQQLTKKEKEIDILKTALGQASIEAFGKKESFVSSNYPKKIVNANEYMEFLIYIASKEKENGNKK